MTADIPLIVSRGGRIVRLRSLDTDMEGLFIPANRNINNCCRRTLEVAAPIAIGIFTIAFIVFLYASDMWVGVECDYSDCMIHIGRVGDDAIDIELTLRYGETSERIRHTSTTHKAPFICAMPSGPCYVSRDMNGRIYENPNITLDPKMLKTFLICLSMAILATVLTFPLVLLLVLGIGSCCMIGDAVNANILPQQ